MPEPTGSEARLQALRRRWETEKSTAFLPLAEEYRRLGRLREAIDVLETGLKGNPTYTSGLVALGRCRLESGDASGAAAVLERVVAQDPEQLVASKLLIEAHLRTGKAREARRRLDIYSTLNAKDPEIARLAERLLALASPAAAAAPAVPAPAVSAPLVPAVTAAARELEPVPSAAAPVVAETPVAAPTFASPARVGLAAVFSEGVLFRGLDGPVAVSRYVRGLASEGLFQLMFPAAVPPAPPSLAVEVPPVFPPQVIVMEPEGESAEEPVRPAAPAEPVVERIAAQAPPPVIEPPVLEAPMEAAPAAAAPAAVSPLAPTLEPFEADVERAISGFVPVASARPPAAPLESAASEPTPPPQAAAEVTATPVPVPAAAPTAAQETATLGELYLQQGHAAEAERIFGAVLGRDPQNDEARRGLGEAQERLRQAGGLSARRAGALRDYLRRLTRREDRHVP